MEFTGVISTVNGMEAWNASGNGFSFVISRESKSGLGFRGQSGFMASWRPIDQVSSAVRVGGSPLETLAEAESACRSMARLLTKTGVSRRQPHVNFDSPAALRKWASLGNQRRVESQPYLLVDGTLDECLKLGHRSLSGTPPSREGHPLTDPGAQCRGLKEAKRPSLDGRRVVKSLGHASCELTLASVPTSPLRRHIHTHRRP
jgi:hypothetical protein